MARDRLIDFDSPEVCRLFNPRLGERERGWLERARWPELPGHIWLASSGTTRTNSLKVLALSKRAFLIAAAAANRHLQSGRHDVWLNPLPLFHVGGLAILARAYLSGAKVVGEEELAVPAWSASRFVDLCRQERVTLASLVPTQVYDLVAAGLRAPPSLRGVLVGGGALAPELYRRARALGWPLLPTYGMSEFCSQVATVPLESLHAPLDEHSPVPEAELLSHVEARVGEGGFLELRGEALFTFMGEVSEDGLRELQWSGSAGDGTRRTPLHWYRTEDIVEIHGRCLRFLARSADLLKVGGELVNLARLNAQFSENFPARATLLGESDPRLGSRVVAVGEVRDRESLLTRVREFNRVVAPFERVQGVYLLLQLPVTDLGKIRRGDLTRLLEE